MEVDAFLADAVQVSPDLKLHALGMAWSILGGASLPVQHTFGVGIVVRVPYTATNQDHNLEVSIEDEDGNVIPLGPAPPGFATEDGLIRRIGGPFNMGRPPGLRPGDVQVLPWAITLGVELNHAGLYCVVIYIDGGEVKRLPFRLNVGPPVAGPIIG